MASHGISFTLNDQMLDRLLAEQKRRGRTAISVDLFAKELVVEHLYPNGQLDKAQ